MAAASAYSPVRRSTDGMGGHWGEGSLSFERPARRTEAVNRWADWRTWNNSCERRARARTSWLRATEKAWGAPLTVGAAESAWFLALPRKLGNWVTGSLQRLDDSRGLLRAGVEAPSNGEGKRDKERSSSSSSGSGWNLSQRGAAAGSSHKACAAVPPAQH